MLRVIEGVIVLAEPALESGRTEPGRTEDGRTMVQVLEDVARTAESMCVRQNLSLSEYSEYIAGCIDSFDIDSSQDNISIYVEITVDGLSVMQADPNYEAWVLSVLQIDFAYEDPWGGTDAIVVHSFGASKDDYTLKTSKEESGKTSAGSDNTYGTAGSKRRTVWQRAARQKQVRGARRDPYAAMRARLRMERLLRKMSLERMRRQTELLEHAALHRRDVEEMHRTGRRMRHDPVPAPRVCGSPATMLFGAFGIGRCSR